MGFGNLGLRDQILAAFAVFSIISLVLTGTVILLFTGIVGNMTITQSNSAVITQVKESLLSTAEQNALVIQTRFENIAEIVTQVSVQATEAFNPDIDWEDRDCYFAYNDSYLDHESFVYSEVYDQNISWSYSSYSFPDASPDNYMPQTEAVNRSAHLDYAFRAAHAAQPDLRWIYMGFAESGVFRNYPGASLYLDEEAYDPRGEEWYTDGMAGNGEIVYTEPYFDEFSGELMMSIVKQAKIGTSPLGVSGADLTTKTYKEVILNVQVLETGYAALLSADGTCVAHPDLDESELTGTIPTLWELEDNAISSSDFSDDNDGVISYKRNGENRYLAYVPVGDSGYTLVTVAKEKEALSPLSGLQTRLQGTQETSQMLIVSIIAVTVVIALIVGLLVARKISEPVERLSKIANKLTSENIQQDLRAGRVQLDEDLLEREDEIGNLARSFQGLLDSFKKE